MSVEDPFDVHIADQPGTVQKNPGWLLALGILLVLLGLAGLTIVLKLTLAGMVYIGVIAVAAGCLLALGGLLAEGGRDKRWQLLAALLYLLAGGLIIAFPAESAVWFSLLIAGFLLLVGIRRIVFGLQMRKFLKGWAWTVLAGVVAVFFAMIILSQWPVSGLWVVGLFIALELILQGGSMVAVALSIRARE